ncbi:Ankyrin repeat domain-containing protein 16 [Trichoplax sp. H2]|nr:Ankyrin repeat domain-containing protein 16 [Trichoplax sp. H2]|eukprot:RDD43839.1 Ankyrin repeat domain-containing protein 16 [Trichoplax sp. H2]
MQVDGESFMKYVQDNNITAIQTILANAQNSKKLLSYKRKKSGDTPMIIASRCGHLQLMQLFYHGYGVPFTEMNNDNKQPLHEAAQFEHTLCVRFMLQYGADVNSLKRADWTPLMLACTKQNIDTIKTLIEYHADTKMVNKDKWNCFHIACREGNPDIINYLLDVDNRIWQNTSNNGRTPLHTAALHGNLEIVKILLDRCSYPIDIADRCGTTPFMDAIKGDHVNLARTLAQDYQADKHATDNMGREAIHLAAHTGAIRSIHFLHSELRIAINTLTKCGKTALHCAAKDGQLECIENLILLGIKINAQDHRGHTALHMAAAGGYASLISILVHDFGAIDLPNFVGVTAEQLSRNEVFQTLIPWQDIMLGYTLSIIFAVSVIWLCQPAQVGCQSSPSANLHGKITVHFLNYENQKGLGWRYPACNETQMRCPSQFHICIGHAGKSCYQQVISKFFKTKITRVPLDSKSNLSKTISNPFTISYYQPLPENLSVHVEVFDRVNKNLNHVDRINSSVSVEANSTQTYKLLGTRPALPVSALTISFQYQCDSNWTGQYCESAVCAPDCNLSHAHCNNKPGQCICNDYWKGPNCSECVKAIDCSENGMCVNGGDCVCKANWGGKKCNKDLNPCRNQPCGRYGNCSITGSVQNPFNCSCENQYAGDRCQYLRPDILSTQSTFDSIQLEWLDVNPNVSQGVIDKPSIATYYILYRLMKNSNVDIHCIKCFASNSTRQTQYHLVNLLPAVHYQIQITAIIGADSQRAVAIHGHWKDATTKGPPGAPTIVDINTGKNEAHIKWTLSAQGTGGYLLRQLNFSVQYWIPSISFNWNSHGDSCNSCWLIPSVRRDGDEYLQNLQANTTYAVRIVVSNPAGHNVSSWKAVTTKGLPDRAEISQVITTGYSAIVSWPRISYNGGYQLNDVTYSVDFTAGIQKNPEAAMTCIDCIHVTQSMGYANITNLEGNTTYQVRVETKNRAGSSFSLWKVMRTKGLPGQPTIFNITIFVNTVTINWMPVGDNGGYTFQNIVYYIEYFSIDDFPVPAGKQYHRTRNTNKTSLTFVIYEDAPTFYLFRLIAVNPAGSRAGDWIRGKIQGLEPSKCDIVSTRLTNTTATLSWNAITYNGKYRLSEVTYYAQYKIFDGESGDCTSCTSTSKTTNTFTEIIGLNPDTLYRFRIIAVNPYGYSSGKFTEARTKANPPPKEPHHDNRIGVYVGIASGLAVASIALFIVGVILYRRYKRKAERSIPAQRLHDLMSQSTSDFDFNYKDTIVLTSSEITE